jgi:hypothetical protein
MLNFMTPVKQMDKGLYFIFTKVTLTMDDKRNWAKIKKINTRKFCLEIKIR